MPTNKISASELSRKFVRSALLVGSESIILDIFDVSLSLSRSLLTFKPTELTREGSSQKKIILFLNIFMAKFYLILLRPCEHCARLTGVKVGAEGTLFCHDLCDPLCDLLAGQDP